MSAVLRLIVLATVVALAAGAGLLVFLAARPLPDGLRFWAALAATASVVHWLLTAMQQAEKEVLR